MKAGKAFTATVKPRLRNLRIEGVNENDLYINEWTWMPTGELAESVHYALLSADRTRGTASPTALGLEVFARYGLLNSEQNGEAFVTWVILYENRTEYAILGKAPMGNLLTPDHGKFEIHIPAAWGLNILELAKQGVVRVSVRKWKKDPHDREYHILTGHMLDGAERDILLTGNPPQCRYYLQKDQLV